MYFNINGTNGVIFMPGTVTKTYRVVGRYMNGANVSAYHLMGNDGSQLAVTKERAIYMVGKGLIDNLRIQTDAEKGVILRGKGINLLSLPVYDEKKNEIRQGYARQGQETTAHVSNLQECRITYQIRSDSTCIGYVVEDASGKSLKLRMDKVVEMAQQGIVTNATAVKKPGSVDANGVVQPGKFFLRGTNGTDLSKLPVIMIDASGNLVDTTKEPVRVRITKMKCGGIIYDTIKNKKILFNIGDYLVCGKEGMLRAVSQDDAPKMFGQDKSGKPAICDSKLGNLSNYPIEIFGQTRRVLEGSQVLNWSVVIYKKP